MIMLTKREFCCLLVVVFGAAQAAVLNITENDVKPRSVTYPVEKETLCEGEAKTIECEADKSISISSAFYGRMDSTICLVGTIHTNKCSSITSLIIMQNFCSGKRMCTVEALNTVFTDPCQGTSKYLELEYSCIPDPPTLTIEERFICEGDTETISCPANEMITVVRATYGRTDATNCPSHRIYTTSCSAMLAEDKVKALCNGQEQCVLPATNEEYGDPCAGTRKYLHVRYSCM